MNAVPDQETYVPIYLGTMRANTLQLFSIYIKIADNYVLYHTGGERLNEEVLNKLIYNKITFVYIRKKDTGAYNEYLAENLSLILRDPVTSVEEKAEIANYSIRTIAHYIFEQPDPANLKLFRQSVVSATDFILNYEEAIYALIRMTSYNFTIPNHSINVGIFATGLAKTILRNDPAHKIQEIAMGFFLHDIGKSLIPESIMNKPGPLTHSEWKTMKLHPSEGFKLLTNNNIRSEEIKIIVTQHHERNSGKGYPRGLKGNQIHMYSKICLIADIFEALTSHRPYKKRHDSSFNALLTMKNEMLKEFDPFFFQQFVLLFRNTFGTSHI
ncbi:HD domain-containing protein [bacterium]|nr:HD domain-containing protein [bacterium]